jgi:pyruvate/2-oxoglutarate dehydrogenase complex dihydrolipoamide dehydrogenase (E3) component
VAAVGEATWAEDAQDAPRVRTRWHDHVDRAVTEGRTDGFARLALGRRSRVVGATVVGPRAGETLAELTLAVRKGLSVGDVAGTMHPYPTYGDGPWNAAIDTIRASLATPAVRLVTGTAVRLRRVGRRPSAVDRAVEGP